MGTQQLPLRRRRSGRTAGTLVTLMVLFSVITLNLPPGVSFGQTEPTIELLNPSSYAETGTPGMTNTIVVSAAEPNFCPDEDHCNTGPFYHLSAWTANAPVGSSVVFVAIQGILEFEINAIETSPGTWEAEWNMPDEIQEGLPGTIQAFIVIGNAPVASDEESVTYSHVQDNAQFGYPSSGLPFGTFAPLQQALPGEDDSPSRRLPRAGIDVNYTDSAQLQFVRVYYTTSPSGTEPEWKLCAEELNIRLGLDLRCVLEDESEQLQVTALAALPNDSPSDEFDPAFNKSGDVARPSEVYVQEPGTLNVLAGGIQTVATLGSCSVNTQLQLLDTRGNEIAGANLDYHAVGPDDRLKFNSPTTGNLVDGIQGVPPDRDSSHTTEAARDCRTNDQSQQEPRLQGEHQRFGAPDLKHLETRPGADTDGPPGRGTNNQGEASFRLRSPQQGTTFWSAWVDEAPDEFLTNNDVYDVGEVCVNGSIGWVVEAPAPSTTEPVACGSTVPLPSPTGTSTASPSPSPSETGEPSGDRSITLERNKSRIRKGRSVRFVGEITAFEIPACESGERVKLKAKRPRTRRFRTVALAQTDNEGTYRVVLRPKRTKIYRAVAPPNTPCERAKSNKVKVRVRNAS